LGLVFGTPLKITFRGVLVPSRRSIVRIPVVLAATTFKRTDMEVIAR